MARKDDLLVCFLEHDIIRTKYNVRSSDLPINIREALNSNIPIIKTIALIVDNLESHQAITDKGLRDLILQHLNQTAI